MADHTKYLSASPGEVKMADEADLTQERLEIEERMRAKVLAEYKMRPQQFDADGALICDECGGSMPLGRSLQGYPNCVECQTVHEKKGNVGKRVFN